MRARYADASQAWEQARAITPDNLIVLRNLGAAYFRSRRYDEAASVLQRALEVRPAGPILANLGNIYFIQGRYSDAVGAFERALQLDANNYLYWGNLGDAYRRAPGRRPEAAAAYRRASEILGGEIAAKPADAELRTRHALYLVKSGDTAAALAELERCATPRSRRRCTTVPRSSSSSPGVEATHSTRWAAPSRPAIRPLN